MKNNFEMWLRERMQTHAHPSPAFISASRDLVREGIESGRSIPLERFSDGVRTRRSPDVWILAAVFAVSVGLAILVCKIPPVSPSPNPERWNGVDLKPQQEALSPQQGVVVPPQQEFEVAAIREEAGPLNYLRFQANGDRFSSEGTSLAALIRYAYNVSSFQVIGGPGWVQDRNVQFRVQAKAEKPASAAELRGMLQALLAARFRLKLTHQVHQKEGYVLRVDKSGAKFKGAAELGPEGCLPFPAKCTRTTMTGFAGYLSTVVFRMPVVDRTGLTGQFDIALDWHPDATQFGGNGGIGFFAGDPSGPSIFVAMKEQLGLALEPSAVPTEILIVDSAEKPSEN